MISLRSRWALASVINATALPSRGSMMAPKPRELARSISPPATLMPPQSTSSTPSSHQQRRSGNRRARQRQGEPEAGGERLLQHQPGQQGRQRQGEGEQKGRGGHHQPLQGHELAHRPQQKAEARPADPQPVIRGRELGPLDAHLLLVERQQREANGQAGEENEIADADRIIRPAARSRSHFPALKWQPRITTSASGANGA